MLLTVGVINETFTDEYVLHLFMIPLKLEDDWQHAEDLILESAQIECAAYLESARPYFEIIQKRYAMEVTQIDPRVSVLLPEPGRVNLLVRIPTPARRKGRVEQAIVKRFMAKWKQYLDNQQKPKKGNNA
jgi:hypothetical protein